MFKAMLGLVLLISTHAMADSAPITPDIFKHPARAGGTQFLLGLAEWIASAQLRPGLPTEDIDVLVAQRSLQFAMDLPVSEEQRVSIIEAIKNNPENLDLDGLTLKAEAANRIERLESAPLTSVEVRNAALEKWEMQVTEARAAAVEAAAKRGALPKGLRVLRRMGSVLLLVDIAARIYVWNALDADPTLSPTVTFVQDKLGL